jgi:hypothetical protein
MKIYNYSALDGEYIGESNADESPLEPGVFLIPANATTIVPPAEQDGKTINFENGAWVLKDIPEPEEEPEPEPFTYMQNRAMEYPSPFDYLDAVVKGDQAQINKYIADCLAVKQKYPKP